MEHPDRLHALDAVRAFALLLGLVLHSSAAFLQGFPIAMWKDVPSEGAAVLYFSIHVFRMSAFFLIAGFFARLVVERRGVKEFIKDRAKRIAIPLFLFGPVVLISIGLGFAFGALPHGTAYLLTAQADQTAAPASGAAPEGGGGINTAHLWFLYYLLIFYAIALVLRAVIGFIDRRGLLAMACDRLVAVLMGPVYGPLLIGLPIAAWLARDATWNEWLGLPAPTSFVPDANALVGYGLAFGLGWLLNRQVPRLLALQRSWPLHLLIAVALTIFCLYTIGTTPRWMGPNLAGMDRLLYTLAYTTAMWCWIFGVIGAAVRYLSDGNPKVRYLADASYWMYLMHMTTIIFFLTLVKPWPLPWFVKFAIMVVGSLPILLGSYHAMVRFTWIGAILNGRRHPREPALPR